MPAGPLRERSKTLVELKNSALNIINSPETYDEKAVAKFINTESKELLKEYAANLEDKNISAKDCEDITIAFLEKRDKKLKDIAQPIRIAITGSAVSPSIFEVIEAIGIKELKYRIAALLEKLD